MKKQNTANAQEQKNTEITAQSAQPTTKKNEGKKMGKKNTAPKTEKVQEQKAESKTATIKTYKNIVTPVLSADSKSIIYTTSAQDTAKEYTITRNEWNSTADRKRLQGLCAEIALNRAEDKLASLEQKKANAEDATDWAEGTENSAELKGVQEIRDRIKAEQTLRGYNKNAFERTKTPQHLIACYIMNEPLPIDSTAILDAIKAYTEQARNSVDRLQNGESVQWTEEERAKATTIRQAIKAALEPYYTDGFKLSIRFEHKAEETEAQKAEVTLLDIIFGTSLADGRKLYDLTEKQKGAKKYKATTKEFNRLLLRIGIEHFIKVAPKN